MKIDSKLII